MFASQSDKGPPRSFKDASSSVGFDISSQPLFCQIWSQENKQELRYTGLNPSCPHESPLLLSQHSGVWFKPLDLTKFQDYATRAGGPLFHYGRQAKHQRQRNLATLSFCPGWEGSMGPRISQKAKFLSVCSLRLLDQDSHISEILTFLYVLSGSVIWCKHSGGHLAITALQKFKNHLIIGQVLKDVINVWACLHAHCVFVDNHHSVMQTCITQQPPYWCLEKLRTQWARQTKHKER